MSAEASGRVTSVDVLDSYGRLDFVYFKPMVEVGDRVLGPQEASDFPTWLCGFMLNAPTVKEAIAKAQAVNDDVVERVTLS